MSYGLSYKYLEVPCRALRTLPVEPCRSIRCIPAPETSFGTWWTNPAGYHHPEVRCWDGHRSLQESNLPYALLYAVPCTPCYTPVVAYCGRVQWLAQPLDPWSSCVLCFLLLGPARLRSVPVGTGRPAATHGAARGRHSPPWLAAPE